MAALGRNQDLLSFETSQQTAPELGIPAGAHLEAYQPEKGTLAAALPALHPGFAEPPAFTALA